MIKRIIYLLIYLFLVFLLTSQPFWDRFLLVIKVLVGPIYKTNMILNVPIILKNAFAIKGFGDFRKEKNTDIKRFLTMVLSFGLLLMLFWIIFLPYCQHLIPASHLWNMNRFAMMIQIPMYIFAAYGLGKCLKE